MLSKCQKSTSNVKNFWKIEIRTENKYHYANVRMMHLCLELCMVLTSLPLKNGAGELGKVQRRAAEIITGMEQLLCGAWLTRQGLYWLEEITEGE